MSHTLRLCLAAAFVTTLAIAPGCSTKPADPCQPATTRCRGNTVDVCGSDGRWLIAQDCNVLPSANGVQWTCAEVDAIHACVPATQGDGADAAADGGEDAS